MPFLSSFMAWVNSPFSRGEGQMGEEYERGRKCKPSHCASGKPKDEADVVLIEVGIARHPGVLLQQDRRAEADSS